jgi:hypothetical protein
VWAAIVILGIGCPRQGLDQILEGDCQPRLRRALSNTFFAASTCTAEETPRQVANESARAASYFLATAPSRFGPSLLCDCPPAASPAQNQTSKILQHSYFLAQVPLAKDSRPAGQTSEEALTNLIIPESPWAGRSQVQRLPTLRLRSMLFGTSRFPGSGSSAS